MHTAVIVGHVDHGKSTLIGRMLMTTGQIQDDKAEKVVRICESKGIELEPAFFLDALQEEQAQGITIDTTSTKITYKGTQIALIDVPGHMDFLKNMVSGASRADCGVLVLDALEGIKPQTGRHLKVLSVMGITRAIVVINKMDAVENAQDRFESLAAQVSNLVSEENLVCSAIVPVSARYDDNITDTSHKLSWYLGKPFMDILLEMCTTEQQRPSALPLRMVLQDVYKFDENRYFSGLIVSGSASTGDQISFSPSGKSATIQSITVYPQGDIASAGAGSSVALRLEEPLFVERGEVVSRKGQTPIVNTEVPSRLVWISSTPFDPHSSYLLKLGTKTIPCTITIGTEGTANQPVQTTLTNGDFADVIIHAAGPVAFDKDHSHVALTRLVICSKYETVAAGVIYAPPANSSERISINPNVKRESGYLERETREKRQNHRGAVIWLTGLSGSGKSTLAKALEQRFFRENRQVVVLDADNVRLGLCADLKFSREDRSENVRRLAEVANLLCKSGIIAIVAAISPFERDRGMARQIIGEADFVETFVSCPLSVCQERDPKELYKKASLGQIQSFTAVDSPYEPPSKPHLQLDSAQLSIAAEEQIVVEHLIRRGILQDI